MKTTTRMRRAARLLDRATGEGGQVLSEYVTVTGMMAVTVIACMAAFVSPVAMVYARLFRRLVLYFTSP
ncbi:MAG: hypothetical protein NTY02_15905 [Acidobacteria bacterium]|nr:hypothetical protein [Acidobacteriota bacterium]